MSKLISVVSPCYNEEGNVRELSERVRAVFAALGEKYRYEHIFIDNSSVDGTMKVLRELAAEDAHVKIILNQRNFGHVRSPNHAMLQARGDGVVIMASDLQDPPELIPDFLAKWEEGFKVCVGVKASTREGLVMKLLRSTYYQLVTRLADVQLIQHTTGFGVYDKQFIDLLREMDDPYPYTRGLISELGFSCATIPYDQPKRTRGITKNNLYTLYDFAMLGITSHTIVPLRVATIGGFMLSFASFCVAMLYLVYKLAFWNSFTVGIAPLVIGMFLSFSVQLFFLGLLGEYIAFIRMRIVRRPLVVEKERINFDEADAGTAPRSLPAALASSQRMRAAHDEPAE